jgi:hypothetical protein
MEPFNVKIGYGANEVTLTVLPTNEKEYKIIYYGAVLGAVKYQQDCWELIPLADLEAGDLPYYHHDVNSGNINVILDDATVDAIGEEIMHFQSTDQDS